MANSPTGLTKQVGVQLPVSDYLKVRYEATLRKISMAKLINEWIQSKIDQLPDPPKAN